MMKGMLLLRMMPIMRVSVTMAMKAIRPSKTTMKIMAAMLMGTKYSDQFIS